MLTNKWLLVLMGAASALLGYFGTVDWNTMVPSEAGAIITALGVAKVVLAGLMPPNNQRVITMTGGRFFTHT